MEAGDSPEKKKGLDGWKRMKNDGPDTPEDRNTGSKESPIR